MSNYYDNSGESLLGDPIEGVVRERVYTMEAALQNLNTGTGLETSGQNEPVNPIKVEL